MVDILLEVMVSLCSAACLMMFHESVKLVMYIICQKNKCVFRTSPWKLWRYIDPVGLVLAVVCFVPVSKPYFFRIHDQKTNRCLGITGLLSLLFVLAGSVLVIRGHYGGLNGIDHMTVVHWWQKLMPMFWQCLALQSFGMFVVNLFPVSVFDLGLCLAGFSSTIYLSIIKSDGVIKLILMLVLFLDLIHYAGVRILLLVL